MARTGVANLIHASRASLLQERAGIASARDNARAIADLRAPAKPAVTAPPAIRSAILGGVATADLLAVLDALGIVSDETTFGDEEIANVQDDALIPTIDRHTIVDGAIPVFVGETGAWEPVSWQTISGLLTYGRDGSPTVAKLTGAGTTAVIASVAGGNFHGEFNITPGGTGIAAGAFVQITFDVTLPSANYNAWLIPRNQNASVVDWYTGTRGTTSVAFNANAALTSGQTYTFTWLVVGR